MDLHQLRYFVAAAEAGSISRAAERSNVSQPSLSQQIRRLEDGLGVRLFDRLGRGIALTDAGRALLPRARHILAEVEEAADAVQTDPEAGRGRLSIGAIPTMAPFVLPSALASLRSQFPECEIEVREDLTEHLVEAVIDNAIDIAVMSTPVDHELIELDVIGREELLVVVAAREMEAHDSTSTEVKVQPHSNDAPMPAGNCRVRHPVAVRESDAGPLRPQDHDGLSTGSTPAMPLGISLADLRDRPTISLHEMHCLGQQISGFCARRRIATNIVCRMTQIATMLEFVRLGMGISLVPEMVARQDTHPERTYLRVQDDPPTREIAIIRRRGRTCSRPATEFALIIRSQIETAGGGLDHVSNP
ncbi:MAG: LysR family transcriptional regulator [Planctomycetota bacterium]